MTIPARVQRDSPLRIKQCKGETLVRLFPLGRLAFEMHLKSYNNIQIAPKHKNIANQLITIDKKKIVFHHILIYTLKSSTLQICSALCAIYSDFMTNEY